MTKTTKKTFSALAVGAIAFLWASGGIATDEETACAGHAAPELAYSAFVEAAKADDWETAFTHVEPGSRADLYKETIGGLVVFMGMMADEVKWQEFTAILQSHGFEVNAEHQLLLADANWHEIKDRPRLMVPVSDFMARNFKRPLVPDHYRFTDLQTTGDKSVATLKLPRKKEKTVRFRKTDSGWCLAAR